MYGDNIRFSVIGGVCSEQALMMLFLRVYQIHRAWISNIR